MQPGRSAAILEGAGNLIAPRSLENLMAEANYLSLAVTRTASETAGSRFPIAQSRELVVRWLFKSDRGSGRFGATDKIRMLSGAELRI
jgi:hypothetical protein